MGTSPALPTTSASKSFISPKTMMWSPSNACCRTRPAMTVACKYDTTVESWRGSIVVRMSKWKDRGGRQRLACGRSLEPVSQTLCPPFRAQVTGTAPTTQRDPGVGAVIHESKWSPHVALITLIVLILGKSFLKQFLLAPKWHQNPSVVTTVLSRPFPFPKPLHCLLQGAQMSTPPLRHNPAPRNVGTCKASLKTPHGGGHQ